MSWEPTTQYAARIGGQIYKDVLAPIVLDQQSLVSFQRNTETGKLGINLAIEQPGPDGQIGVLAVINNQIVVQNITGLLKLDNGQRKSLVNISTGAAVLEIDTTPHSDYEVSLNVSFVFHESWHLNFHPDRTEILVNADRSRAAITGVNIVGEGQKGIGFHISRDGNSFPGTTFGVHNGACLRNARFTGLEVGILVQWERASQ